MMEHHLPSSEPRKRRKRLGRGDSAGQGSYCGRGLKGQKSRSGYRLRPGFEGGQLPLIKGLPMKRGFTNIFKQRYQTVSLDALESFPPGAVVTPESLVEAGILRKLSYPVKVLGGGEISTPLRVSAQSFTRSAREKIEAAGGSVEALPK